MDFGHLLEYAKAVGEYWFAIMAVVAFVTGDLANWLGFGDWLNRVLPKSRRRTVEVAIIIGVIFYAGFDTWDDQRGLAEKADVRRFSSQTWLGTWKSRADERWQKIHGQNGYLDQIDNLERQLSTTRKSGSKAGIPPPPPIFLKRLIAYESPQPLTDTIMQGDNEIAMFKGFAFAIRNVGSDTLRIRFAGLNAQIDGQSLLEGCEFTWTIVAQTQQIQPQCRLDGAGTPIPNSAAKIDLKFEIDYDTIPSTGVRRSYRTLSYDVTWENGKNRPPLLNRITTLAEAER